MGLRNVVFDGSTNPATVVLSDGVLEVRLRFDADSDARLAVAMIRDALEEARTATDRAVALRTAVRAALRESGND